MKSQAPKGFEKMTVPQLRAVCKTRGLPTFQSKGKRLKKADLLRSLEGATSDQNDPKSTAATVSAIQIPSTSVRELMIHSAEAFLISPADDEYRRSMHAVMRGYDTGRGARILSCRRLQAIQHLRDQAQTEGEWRTWTDMYINESKVALATA